MPTCTVYRSILIACASSIATFCLAVNWCAPGRAEAGTKSDQQAPESKNAAESKKATEPYNVWDYYMLLPQDYFEVDRQQLFKDMKGILDNKNGYLHVDGDGAQPTLDLALFKRKHGDYLLAVYIPPADEPIVMLDFYLLKSGKLVKQNISAILPVKFNENLRYKIPRTGTNIQVSNANGKNLYVLKWNGQKFERRSNI